MEQESSESKSTEEFEKHLKKMKPGMQFEWLHETAAVDTISQMQGQLDTVAQAVLKMKDLLHTSTASPAVAPATTPVTKLVTKPASGAKTTKKRLVQQDTKVHDY
ncbi:hypothetical protein ILUMI_07104 [Ignelater luminosus]|uniref:Uncharacterized protein n=1 Tax=Ignelater luminosus TaxID=2038154 RepID=A0A8K0D8Y9_IGNLU|nr:hypothetical protein ILUMI_07104 [Ignelater luminosus]